ncbi:MAG TPA: penicillin-insensitive murein endopeptidase [Devosia sp.]|nr:penicillin-insensitive murein endopeptidase [Devosia sp.]
MLSLRLPILTLTVALLSGFTASSGNNSSSRLETTPAKKLFGFIKTPANMQPRAIGYYTKGCLAGGVQMPVTGSAWQVMRLERNRNWGHPQLIELLKRLAIEAKAQDGWNGLLVGDMSQPRGGPMLTGHASHQMGLDADIWLTPMPNRILSRKERATISAKLMVLDRKRINPKRWTNAHARLIRRAASYDLVQRIFVHPPIKKALCDWSRGQADRSWLRKVRAYYGHNYHFHIRLRCLPGVPGCRSQAEPRPKDGTGCGTELAYWYSDKPWRRAKPPPRFIDGIPIPRKKPRRRRQKTLKDLPRMCRAVLTAK